MAKTLAQIDQQVRELLGDYQRTTYDASAVTEAINWGQDLIQRMKGFKVGKRLYAVTAYPTGTLPSDLLSVKRVLIVTNASAAPGADTADTLDVVLRRVDESTVEQEDAVNELWRNQRASFKPRRWVLLGNQEFTVVPPVMPSGWTTPNTYVRVHYIKMSTPMVDEADTVDPSIPDYYHDAIRYAAVAYLMEKDTDLKSLQLKKDMLQAFGYHMEGGVPPLARTEVDT
jgi:hypothetical protein